VAALLAQQQRTQTIFTYVMVAIAAISLLVGGIGIMNIVLATVMERTREIGVRRSIGARRKDIVRQFLTESVLISTGGGVLGVGFGFFLSWLIATTAEWRTIVSPSSVVIAFGVSVAVGVIFGIYPAMKAAHINPIDALRYEWVGRARANPVSLADPHYQASGPRRCRVAHRYPNSSPILKGNTWPASFQHGCTFCSLRKRR